MTDFAKEHCVQNVPRSVFCLFVQILLCRPLSRSLDGTDHMQSDRLSQISQKAWRAEGHPISVVSVVPHACRIILFRFHLMALIRRSRTVCHRLRQKSMACRESSDQCCVCCATCSLNNPASANSSYIGHMGASPRCGHPLNPRPLRIYAGIHGTCAQNLCRECGEAAYFSM